MKTIFSFLLAVCCLTACRSDRKNELIGEWIQPVPGMENQVQGLVLEKNGTARSVNMQTLQYEKWERKKDKLILTGLSIGNRQTIRFSDTLTIQKLSETELVLQKKEWVSAYKKR